MCSQYLQTIFVSMRAPRLDPEVNALDEELDAVVYADTAGNAAAQEAAAGTMDCSARAERPPSQRASAALTWMSPIVIGLIIVSSSFCVLSNRVYYSYTSMSSAAAIASEWCFWLMLTINRDTVARQLIDSSFWDQVLWPCLPFANLSLCPLLLCPLSAFVNSDSIRYQISATLLCISYSQYLGLAFALCCILVDTVTVLVMNDNQIVTIIIFNLIAIVYRFISIAQFTLHH